MSNNGSYALQNYLQIGMKATGVIEFGPNDQFPIHCSFIGMKEGQFLIFELGAKMMSELITRKLNSANVVIRALSDTYDGHIVAFKSQIIAVKQLVSWLMFLRFPHRVETRTLRENRRYKVEMDADVCICGSRLNSKILDVSISGCALRIEGQVELKVGEEIEIESPFKSLPKPYPKCTVVNLKRGQDCLLAGVKFDRNIEVSDELRYEVFQKLFLTQLRAP